MRRKDPAQDFLLLSCETTTYEATTLDLPVTRKCIVGLGKPLTLTLADTPWYLKQNINTYLVEVKPTLFLFSHLAVEEDSRNICGSLSDEQAREGRTGTVHFPYNILELAILASTLLDGGGFRG